MSDTASPAEAHGRRSVMQAPLSSTRSSWRFFMPPWHKTCDFQPCINDATECKMGLEPAYEVEDDCPICLEPHGDDSVRTSCGHCFHRECFDDCFIRADKRYNFKCPICRQLVYGRMPVEIKSTSCRAIEVVNCPPPASRCHMDRSYEFTDLGSFSEPGMLYILTSNDDRLTSWHSTMWTMQMRFTAAIVYLNFRSENHVRKGRSGLWLRAEGWTLEKEMISTTSSGIPPCGHPVRGPYSGPIYSKYFALGSKCKLRGSNNWEGTYFVFVKPTTNIGSSEAVSSDAGPSEDAPSGTGSSGAEPSERACSSS